MGLDCTLPFTVVIKAPLNVTGEEKNHGLTRTRTQGLLLTVQALCQPTAEPRGSPLTFSPCFIRFVPESGRNNGGLKRHALFDACCPSHNPTLNHQLLQGRKKWWPDRHLNPGPLAYCASTLPNELPSHLVIL